MLTWFRRLRARLKYRHFDRELTEELAAHRAMAEADLEARGLTSDDARPAAARALGNVTLVREDARAVWVARWIEQLWQDVRYALRGFRRQPGFALATILTLGVAVGLLTSVFATFSALYLRPWDLPDPNSVFVVTGQAKGSDGARTSFSLAAFENLRGSIASADVVASTDSNFSLDNGPDASPTTLRTEWATDQFVETLRIPIQLGTGLANTNGVPSVVISHALWQTRFAGRPDVLGQTLSLSGHSATVVGVLGKEFDGLSPRRVDAILNLSSRRVWQPDRPTGHADCCYDLVGRARPGFSRADVDREVAAIGPRLMAQESEPLTRAGAVSTTLGDLPRHLHPHVPTVFTLLFIATVMVLALACANVGNLHLARGVRRQRELAIRLSLGADRPRVVRQLLTESLVLTVSAAAIGLALAVALPKFILSFESDSASYALVPDFRTYAFVAFVSVVACALFAVAPSLRFSRSARLSGATPIGAGRLRSIILGVQVATSVTLVTAATLLTRGVVLTATSDHGFALHDLVVASIVKPPRTYDTARNAALLAHVQHELASQSDVASALTENPPLYDRLRTLTLDSGWVRVMSMTSSSFDVLGMPLLAGRAFADDPAAHEVVVNQALAAQLWPAQSAVGRTLGQRVVVGVASDARVANLTLTVPLLFQPLQQPTTFFVMFRAGSSAERVLRRVISDFDPRLTVRTARVSDQIVDNLDSAIMGASVAGGLGVLALLLSIVGVFGVAAFIVEERRREIGVRLALGAARGDIRRALARAARGPLAGGLAAGLGLSVLGGFFLRSFLLDISPLDPLSYVVVAMLMLTAASVATWLPMRRAVRVDPATTLRAD